MAIRFLVVGTNFITDRFLDAISRVDGVTCQALYSRTASRAEEYGARHGIAERYSDYSLALKSENVDAVYVANPNFAHKETALMAIRAKKHVLCEKIITESLEDFLLLRREAKRMGVVLLEAMRPDFDPAISLLRESLPLVGTVRRVSLEYCQYSSRYDAFLRGEVQNAFDPTIGNSSLADIGIYPLHVLISLFGEPMGVRCRAVSLRNGFMGCGSLALDYTARGFFATVDFSKITDSVRPSVIEGELGSLTVDKMNAPSRIVFYPRLGEPRTLYCDLPENNMSFEVAAFRDMTLGLLSEDPYLDVTEATMRTYDAARLS